MPPHTLELQPAEHLWRLTNIVLVNRRFTSIDDLEDALVERCVALLARPDLIRSTTLFSTGGPGASRNVTGHGVSDRGQCQGGSGSVKDQGWLLLLVSLFAPQLSNGLAGRIQLVVCPAQLRHSGQPTRARKWTRTSPDGHIRPRMIRNPRRSLAITGDQRMACRVSLSL